MLEELIFKTHSLIQKMKPLIRLICSFAFVLTLAFRATAHDVGLSTADIQLQPGGVQVTVSFAPRDMDILASLDTDHDGRVSTNEFRAGQQTIHRVLTAGCVVSNDNSRMEPASVGSKFAAEDYIEAQLVFPLSKPGDQISFPVLRALPAGHRMFVQILGPTNETVLGQVIAQDSAPIILPANNQPHETPHTFSGFLLLGVEHIGTGYDHLLFLFGLLLVTRTLKSALAVITSFTLAHSLTLAASTLNLVTLRPAITEPLIALSIVFVGVENLIRHGEPKHRWLLTFVFGLIHGFGFASVLRDLGVTSQGGVALPLFSFNLGVELGQLAVAALMLPILWKLRTNETYRRRVAPGCSVLIVGAGAFWFWQRVWGG